MVMNERLVRLLLAKGADINAPAGIAHGKTALQAAAEHHDTRILKLLLENGADVLILMLDALSWFGLKHARRLKSNLRVVIEIYTTAFFGSCPNVLNMSQNCRLLRTRHCTVYGSHDGYAVYAVVHGDET